MNIFITGVCGFVGSSIARHLVESDSTIKIVGMDNLARPGSETNRRELVSNGIDVRHGDLRLASDLETIGPMDFVIDAAALPSVLAGVDGANSSLQLVQHNLLGTIHLLELCKRHHAGFLLLSTSRVYSIEALTSLSLDIQKDAFVVSDTIDPGLTDDGINENFSTAAPVSMYGATKIASETMALEYGLTYDFPVWINRCGVLAGAGQFGRADQGIFSFWLHSHLRRQPLKYLGFGGSGHQVRDCLNVRDLSQLVSTQIASGDRKNVPRTINVSGGQASAMSLKQLTQWCDDRFGKHAIQSSDEERPFDLPWVVLDSALANQHWNWKPEVSMNDTLEEIAVHAESNPGWLELSQ
ncbi:NAD-dependent epimerase/dehydratase family protein [Rubripirellula amarantea]|nr:NAD-dependent epimerase/dehydratase family protein [Rubripirellula amarantea]